MSPKTIAGIGCILVGIAAAVLTLYAQVPLARHLIEADHPCPFPGNPPLVHKSQ